MFSLASNGAGASVNAVVAANALGNTTTTTVAPHVMNNLQYYQFRDLNLIIMPTLETSSTGQNRENARRPPVLSHAHAVSYSFGPK